MPDPTKVAVLGAGSWGTALAIHAARAGHDTRLWTRRPDDAAAMIAHRRNPRYLKDAAFPEALTPTHDIDAALDDTQLCILAIPSHALRGALAPLVKRGDAATRRYLIAAKGVENETLETMDHVVVGELGDDVRPKVAALGGPSFAAEVATGQPTAVVIAAHDQETAQWIQAAMSDAALRAYITNDVLGVELGGAFKNVVALAAGMSDGAGLGLNARAAVMTRGLAENSRLAIALGADPRTLAGLAGMGDLVLTCTGGLSRNRRVGLALGQGRALQDILDEMGMVAEGVKNTRSAKALAEREGVEMPIAETMYEILYGDLSVRDAIDALMGRALKSEQA